MSKFKEGDIVKVINQLLPSGGKLGIIQKRFSDFMLLDFKDNSYGNIYLEESLEKVDGFVCFNCDKIFEGEPYNVISNNKFCSRECAVYPHEDLPKMKASNPKDALGVKKVPLHCVPCGPLFELGLAMMEGGRKYGSHNYRKIGVRVSTYYDAVMRHLMAYWEGEDIDPDSGVPHIIKAIACLFVLRDSQLMENCEDDRPLKYPKGMDMDKFNEVTKKLLERYPECKEPFLEKNND